MKGLVVIIKSFMFVACFLPLFLYGQAERVFKREVLSNGDTAVWTRGKWRTEIPMSRVYFQKEHESYVYQYKYKDTVRARDLDVDLWRTYHSLSNPDIWKSHKDLGDFLVENIGALGKEFRLPLFVVFMLDGNGRIVSVDHFSFVDSLCEKIPAEYLFDVSRRMKKEIKYPQMYGKRYYPWGVKILREDMEHGHYEFQYFPFNFLY